MTNEHPYRSIVISVPVDRPPVRITAEPGVIRIAAPVLFPSIDTTALHRLVARILTVDDIETVEIDHTAEEVLVHYSRRRLDVSTALSRIGEALRNAPLPTHDAATLDIELGQIVGKVIRVERRHRWGGMITTIVSSGADLLSAASRKIMASRSGLAQGNARLPLRTLHCRDLAIRYLPHPEAAQLNRRSPAIVVLTGWRRVASLTAAGGCFFLSFVGIVTPGIPTVPFVMATSYFLVRSSPALDERLRRSWLFGQMVRDWTTYGGMRSTTKCYVLLLSLGLSGGTLLIAEPSAPILAVMGVMGAISVTMLLLTPTVPDEAPDDVIAASFNATVL
jgi:uncharacterized protein